MSKNKEEIVDTNKEVPDVDLEPNEDVVVPQDAQTEEEGMDKVKAELEEQKNKYMRLFAEFDNFKKRNARERLELMQTAGKDIVVSLLDVLDDCDRAEKQIEATPDAEQVKEGVRLVFNKLRKTLEARGVKAMKSIGTEFDVEKHEAVTEVEAGKDKKGKVVDEIMKGYYLNDKLIRFAKVVVGK
jgi:molecular chaperone GrpE